MKKEKQDMRILVVSKKNIMNGGRVVHNRLSLHHESSLYLFNTSFLYRLLRLFGRKRQHAYATRVFTKKNQQDKSSSHFICFCLFYAPQLL